MADGNNDPLPPMTPTQGNAGGGDDIGAWFQNAPVPMHSMNAAGLLIAVNEEWAIFTGYAMADAIGHSFAEFLEPVSAQRYLEAAVPEIINDVPADQKRSVGYQLVRKKGQAADIVLTRPPHSRPRDPSLRTQPGRHKQHHRAKPG